LSEARREEEKTDEKELEYLVGAATVADWLACGSGIAAAQASQYGQGSQSQPPAKQSDKPKTPEATPLTLERAGAVNAEEDCGVQGLSGRESSDAAKKVETGEAFLLKYPEKPLQISCVRVVDLWPTCRPGIRKRCRNTAKGNRVVPNDVSTLALLGQTCSNLAGSASDPLLCRCGPKAEQFPSKPSKYANVSRRPET